MKKLSALLLALVMTLGLATTAFAADTTNLTINDGAPANDPRDYVAYKLLNASVDGLKFAYTENAKYSAALIEALGLASTATHDDIKTAIKGKNDSEEMRHFADALYRIIKEDALTADETWEGNTKELEQGYWLIADVTNLDETSMQYESNSLVMIDTVGDVAVTVDAKPDLPSTEKKLDDENDSLVNPSPVSEDAINLQDVADYDIGDDVPYTIDVELPNNIAEYAYYSFIIQDSVEAGLTYEPESFKISVNGSDPVKVPEAGSDEAENADFVYIIETDTENGVQTTQRLYVYPNYAYFTNEQKAAGITDSEQAKLGKEDGGDFLQIFATNTSHASINSSEVVFTYTCELNENAVIGGEGNPNKYTLKFSNNPYNDSFGETPEDTNIVLTYEAIVNKVDTDGNPLKGADFDLYKFIALVPDTQDKAAAEAKAQTLGLTLKDEEYVDHPAANAWGYFELLDSIKSTNAVADDPAVDGDQSVPATTFTFTGLDDGYYKLVESVIPAGFNGIAPVEFHVTAGHVTDLTGRSIANDLTVATKVNGELSIKGDAINGTLTTNVENRSGTELPTTGGMGTTLFYAVGGLMVAGAVVLLVTKKRMGSED